MADAVIRAQHTMVYFGQPKPQPQLQLQLEVKEASNSTEFFVLFFLQL